MVALSLAVGYLLHRLWGDERKIGLVRFDGSSVASSARSGKQTGQRRGCGMSRPGRGNKKKFTVIAVVFLLHEIEQVETLLGIIQVFRTV